MTVEIDTYRGQVLNDGEPVASYMLESKRKWNVGAQKHMMMLTGRIIVFWKNDKGEEVCAPFYSFDNVKLFFRVC